MLARPSDRDKYIHRGSQSSQSNGKAAALVTHAHAKGGGGNNNTKNNTRRDCPAQEKAPEAGGVGGKKFDKTKTVSGADIRQCTQHVYIHYMWERMTHRLQTLGEKNPNDDDDDSATFDTRAGAV